MGAALKTPVFVVGLERYKERHEALLKSLRAMGIGAQLWSGVDGWGSFEQYDDETTTNWRNYLTRGTTLTKTELACFLSHYRLLKHIFASDWERAVVFEDDVAVYDGSKEVLSKIEQLDQSFEYINMSRPWEKLSQDKFFRDELIYNIGDNVKLFRPYRRLYSASAFAISRRGLAKLLPTLTPIRREFDVAIADAFFTVGLRGFVLAPPIVESPEHGTPTKIVHHQLHGRPHTLRAGLQQSAIKPLRYLYRHYKKSVNEAYYADCELEAERVASYSNNR